MRAFSRSASALLLGASATACSVAPPASQFPTAAAALDRLRALGACGTGVQATAKIDHYGPQGRVRGELLLLASRPDRLRMDVVSPLGATLATLASDGARFSLADLRARRFYTGRASACNIARLTVVPLPGHALVNLLRGQAPLLKQEPGAKSPSLAWSGKGYYVLTVQGTRDAVEELRLAVHPDDLSRAWSAQRVRLVGVTVTQGGEPLYRAELGDYAPAGMAAPRVDPDHVEPTVPPSGPECGAELPRKIHFEVPAHGDDVLFRYDSVVWNPPLLGGAFQEEAPAGMVVDPVECD